MRRNGAHPRARGARSQCAGIVSRRFPRFYGAANASSARRQALKRPLEMHSSAARFQRHPSPSSSKICSGELVPLYTQHRAPLTFRAYQIGPIVRKRKREKKGEAERERERETERNAISFTSPSRTHHRYNSVDDYDKLLDRFVGSKPRFTREQHENVYVYMYV